jgi:hypothetical protein
MGGNASTNKSGANDGSEDASQTRNRNAKINQTRSKATKAKEQQLANVANSVSGFYKDHGPAMSEHSNMSRTQDNFASNMPRRSQMQHNNDNENGAQVEPGR